MSEAVTVLIECPSCSATGLYVGFAERDGAAVVCYTCQGTGCTKYTYTPFSQRRERPGVRRVFERAGVVIVDGSWQFGGGGISPEAWKRGDSFVGHEDRQNMCPFWWTGQDFRVAGCADNRLGSRHANCPHFGKKHECWREYDVKHSGATKLEGGK